MVKTRLCGQKMPWEKILTGWVLFRLD
jgi:hypothetical protein